MNDRSLSAFHRLAMAARGVRSPAWCCAQFHGCASKVVTSGCSSVNSSLRRSIPNAPITPTLASFPSSLYSPSSRDPMRSAPLLWTR